MAYAAAISLKNTIDRLLNYYRISIDGPSRQIINSAFKEVKSLKEALERLDNSYISSSEGVVNDLDGEIRETVHKLEDVLESHLSNQLVSLYESLEDEDCSMDFEEVQQEINSKMLKIKGYRKEYIKVLSGIYFGGKKSKMVGLSDEVLRIKYLLTRQSPKLEFFSFVGMAGIGKTTLAREIFEDQLVLRFFRQAAFVTIGPKYQIKEILQDILVQVIPGINYERLLTEEDETLAEHVYKNLKRNWEYLIVLDDIRNTQVWHYLRRLFPYNEGSRVLLTTRLQEVVDAGIDNVFQMRLLNKEESWDLLREKVFAQDQLCPPQLGKAGKKIAENCEGLPLAIFTVANLLSKAEKTPEYWNKVVEKQNSVVMDANDQMSKIYKITEDLRLSNYSFRDDDNAVSSTIDFGRKKSKMVKLSDEAEKIKDLLLQSRGMYRNGTVSLVGMAGIGKTALVEEIFEDTSFLSHFDCGAWVTIGPKYQLKEILLGILPQVNPKIDIDKMLSQEFQMLAFQLFKSLVGKKYLIFLDDIWNTKVWDFLKRSLPNENDASRVLLTTRLYEVAEYVGDYRPRIHKMRFLNKAESWHLLREKVFAEESCPHQLEKAGRKIAEICEGLPLMIVTVADLLSKEEKTLEYWNKVAEKQNSVFKDAHDQMSEVLFPSYDFLPQHLKPCFLYMGVFPENYKIPSSKLSMLWSAEEFLDPDGFQTVESLGMECLRELVSKSLVMVHKQRFEDIIETCGLHSVFWHLCIREAAKNKFFHVLNNYADGLAEGIKDQRRLCIRNSILFGIKDVYNSMASISTARSLICTGPPHQYPVPIYFGVRLLRVLDALTIRFYEFPIQVLKLVLLRYFALTYNGYLPASISELWNLECLIVRQHKSIKSSGAQSYLPVEIWDMKALKHLQIMGSDLPDYCHAFLPNLLTLLHVSAHGCTKSLLESIPNLEKLGIRIELESDAVEPLHCLDHISDLRKLEILKCVILNPKLRSKVVAPPTPLPIFSSNLRKLTLSGFGYPWDEMSKISSLQHLEVLKLKCYAFQGPKWELKDRFRILEFLLIEDTDLEHWTVGEDSFGSLRRLSIKHCYKLEQILWEPSSPQLIELVDCNPFTVTWAKQLQEEEGKYFDVHSSWDDGNIKS